MKKGAKKAGEASPPMKGRSPGPSGRAVHDVVRSKQTAKGPPTPVMNRGTTNLAIFPAKPVKDGGG